MTLCGFDMGKLVDMSVHYSFKWLTEIGYDLNNLNITRERVYFLVNFLVKKNRVLREHSGLFYHSVSFSDTYVMVRGVFFLKLKMVYNWYDLR